MSIQDQIIDTQIKLDNEINLLQRTSNPIKVRQRKKYIKTLRLRLENLENSITDTYNEK